VVSRYVLRASAWASWLYFIVDMGDKESALDAAEFEIGTDGCSIRRKGGSGTRSRSGGPATRPANQEEIERLLGMAGKTSQYAAKIAELERNVKENESKATNIEKMVFESEREAGLYQAQLLEEQMKSGEKDKELE
jgi:hypothetical protein